MEVCDRAMWCRLSFVAFIGVALCVAVVQAYQEYGSNSDSVVIHTPVDVLGAGLISQWNNMAPNLAADGNVTSCAKTGYHDLAWWVGDLGRVRNVSRVTVHGTMDPENLTVRVGDKWEDTQPNMNPVCGRWPDGPVPISSSGGQGFNCFRHMAGRYVSVSTVGTKGPVQMTVCEVSVDVQS